MKNILTILLLLSVCHFIVAQKPISASVSKNNVKAHVSCWRMVDAYTLADTIPVDTLTNGHQINNKIWRDNVVNVTLGNLGSPSQSMFFLTQRYTEGNIFFNTLQPYLEQPDQFVYYDTKTPYTNLTYTMGYPKRRSEEYVHVLFTQNVNKRLNIGVHFKYLTSIGRYQSQRADQYALRIFGSYNGDYYRSQTSLVYNHSGIKENGGVINDNYIMYPDSFEYDKADDIPVQFMDQKNNTSTYQLHYAHSLDLGHVERVDEDSSSVEIPVGVAYHQLHLLKSHHEYCVGDLSNYSDIFDQLFPALYNDNVSTNDSTRYFSMSNVFQLKLSEEFNTLMKFGLRAFIGNDIRKYHWPSQSTFTLDENENLHILYHQQDATRVTSYIGGKMFKNNGENFTWNAGAKFYFQGYRVGDFIADANLNTMFDVFGRRASVWAKAVLELRSPEMQHERYMSNHYKWNQQLERAKLVNISAGVKVPDLNLELTGFASTENQKVYFNSEGIPDQKSGVVQIVGAYAYKHFSVIGFNSINRLAVQKSSDDEAEPLPIFAIYSSNFYENLFFGVLTLQLGFDWHYNTSYYAPKYIAAIQQFCAQKERKVGNYHYFDPFVNIQLKRARIFVKYEHVNSKWGSMNYFHTIHYPANPGMMKFGVSWNFYD